MNGSWPSQDLRPAIRVRLAMVYLQLLTILRSEIGEIQDDTSAVLAEFDTVMANVEMEKYIGTGTGETDIWNRVEAMSESLFELTQLFSLTDAEWAALGIFLDPMGDSVATRDVMPLAELREPERTEWVVMLLAYVLGLDEEFDDPEALHPHVLDATLTAMYDWLQTDKESPCGEMTIEEQRALREIIATVRDEVTAPDSRRIRITPDVEEDNRERATLDWPNPADPADMVDPLAVRERAVEIAASEESSGSDRVNVRQIAALYAYVRDAIDYVSDPRRNYVAPPEETLEIGGGDCDCQAVAAASLFEAVGAGTRLISVQSDRGTSHLLPVVDLGSESHQGWITNELANFHEEEGTSIERFSWWSIESRLFFLADPVIGRYVGDRHRLVEAGFIHENTDGWDWHGDPDWYRPEP